MQESVQVVGWQRPANGRLQRAVKAWWILGYNFHRWRGGGRCLFDLAHHFRYVILNAFQKRPELGFSTLDPLEIRFPLTGHGGALHLRVDHLNQPDAFVRGFEGLPLPHNIAALE